MDENMQQTSNLLQHFHSNEHNLEELKDSLKEKIASIDNSQHPALTLADENPDDKLKNLNASVQLIDKMTSNFHKATEEEDQHHGGIMKQLNDVISGKMDPSDLQKKMQSDDDHQDVNEMLQHGHLNKTRTTKMKEELHQLMEKNKFYMDKIAQVDKMTNKLKNIHGDKLDENTEGKLVKDLISIDKKRDLENTQGLSSLQEKDDMKNMKLDSKIKPKEKQPEETEEKDRSSSTRQSSIFTDQDKRIGRKGVMSKLDLKQHEPRSASVQAVLNSKSFTVFESQSLLNILQNVKCVFLEVSDLQSTTCFQVKNREDEVEPGVTLCALNNDEKEVWMQDLKMYSDQKE